VEVYQEIGDLLGQSDAYNNLGGVYANLGDWAQASDMYGQSLAIKEDVGDIVGQGMIANNLAAIQLDRGEWAQAVDLYEQSLVVWERTGWRLGEAVTLIGLAQVHTYRENWSEARDGLSRSQGIFAEIGSRQFLAELERCWGELFLRTSKLDEALDHTQRSVELAEEQGDLLEEGMSRRMLGQVHLARGEWGPAEAALRQSLQILSDLNSEYEVAKARLVLVRLAAETDSILGEARLYLAQAVDTFERLGAKPDLSAARELQQQIT
jgi:tetratricopeptide (TPR) repeat protein